MWTVHQRLAELWNIQSNQRDLSPDEYEEMKMCLDANLHKAQKLADLYNYSLLASMTNDTEWQHEICEQIDYINEKI